MHTDGKLYQAEEKSSLQACPLAGGTRHCSSLDATSCKTVQRRRLEIKVTKMGAT